MRAHGEAHYRDALSKGSIVNLNISEIYGGVGGSAMPYLGSLCKLAGAKGGRDDTEYHDPPGNKRLSYREHWSRLLSGAAAFGESARIAYRNMRNRPARPAAPSPHAGAP